MHGRMLEYRPSDERIPDEASLLLLRRDAKICGDPK
jgi:hypothetical protein